MTGLDGPGCLSGIVYLLCFDELYMPYPGAPAYCCARHYTGFVPGGPRALKRRLAEHGTARGARLMVAVRAAGITWQLAWTWPGDRARERQLKRQGGAAPLCGVRPRPGPLPRTADGRVSRSLTTDAQKARAGLMTAAAWAEHTALRRGAVTSKLPRPFERGPLTKDPWAVRPAPACSCT